MDAVSAMMDMEMGIQFSDNVIMKPSQYGGSGMFAKRSIDEGETLLRIPKSAVLSANNSGIANLIAEHPEVELLNLPVVAYLFEKAQSEESPWAAFIEVAEQAPLPDVPRLWNKNEQNLLKGSNVVIWDGLDSEQMKENYERCWPLFEDYAELCSVPPPSYEDFVHATLVVSSRAFEIDNYHELALAPGACFFNHSDKESVHFETDGDVCSSCGGLSCGCITDSEGEDWEDEGDSESDEDHDDIELSDEESNDGGASDVDLDVEETDSEDANNEKSSEDDNACVIMAVKNIAAGEEIFNTYGEDPNGVLLARYGFTVWNNANEVVDLRPQVEKFAKQFKVLKSFHAWLERQEQRIEEEEFLEEDPLFLGIINSQDGPSPSPGLDSLARRLKIERNMFVKKLVSMRLKSYTLQGTSADLHARANAETDSRVKNALTLVGTEKLLLESTAAASA